MGGCVVLIKLKVDVVRDEKEKRDDDEPKPSWCAEEGLQLDSCHRLATIMHCGMRAETLNCW